MAFNLFSWFSSAAATVEADVVKIVAAVKGDIAVAETDINAALQWLAANTPTIVADLQLALQLATAIGGVSSPVLAAANASVVALNAFAAVQNAAQGASSIATSAQSVLAGYKAYTSAQAAVAQAKADAAAAAIPSK